MVYLITVSRHSGTYPCHFNDYNFGYAKAYVVFFRIGSERGFVKHFITY